MFSLFKEPIGILDEISNEGRAEMTEWQLSFLCGLIREYRPKKIVEVGVAAGGTTAVVLNCISLLNLQTEVNSVDLFEKLYSDNSKKTGYLAKLSKKYLSNDVNYKLFTGEIVTEFLEEIGGEIDFLILDTMHILPGELLDFLACFPLLKQGAIVVLHDILLHHMLYKTNAYATQILLDCVVGEKIIQADPSSLCEYPNIGAFKVTCHTKEYIDNVFSALLITWQYLPSEQQIRLYRDFYSRHYENVYLKVFDRAVQLNKQTIVKLYKDQYQSKLSEFNAVYQMIQKIQKYRIYIFGCGKLGEEIKYILETCGLELVGYIISDGIERKGMNSTPYYLSEIEFNEDNDVIVVGVNKMLHKEVEDILRKYKINHYIIPDDKVYNFLERWKLS